MKAIILAAGIGSRLKVLTGNKPKCMVHVNGRCIIDHQLDALLATPVEEVLIVTGFEGEQLEAYVRERRANESRIRFVRNVDYATTNNMYSLGLCADHVRSTEFVLMNGDVVFDPGIIADLVGTSGSAVCVDTSVYYDESMKITVDATRGVATSIAKSIPEAAAFGCSIDLYRFDATGSETLFGHIHQVIQEQGRLTEWTEVALDELMRAGRLAMRPLDIEARRWFEIDNLEDLQKAEILFGRAALDWSSIRMAFVDMDGTLYRGNTPIPGMTGFLVELQARVPHVYFLSNNSSRAHEDYAAKLGAMGAEVAVGQIALSSDALAAHLAATGFRRVYCVGTRAFRQVLADRGVEHDARDPQAVVLGYDTELTYEKLSEASQLLQRDGMPYFATHPDVVCPTSTTPIPDIGAIMALLEATTARRPDRVFGKPSPEAVAPLYAAHDVDPAASVFIGDRVYTDYRMARACGAKFIGVLTGEATRADFEGLRDVIVMPSVAAIFPAPDGAADLAAVSAAN